MAKRARLEVMKVTGSIGSRYHSEKTLEQITEVRLTVSLTEYHCRIIYLCINMFNNDHIHSIMDTQSEYV